MDSPRGDVRIGPVDLTCAEIFARLLNQVTQPRLLSGQRIVQSFVPYESEQHVKIRRTDDSSDPLLFSPEGPVFERTPRTSETEFLFGQPIAQDFVPPQYDSQSEDDRKNYLWGLIHQKPSLTSAAEEPGFEWVPRSCRTREYTEALLSQIAADSEHLIDLRIHRG
ncbi:hypothetical protein NM688_g2544 [Phlebia brevispora]|uniref:Uncharacterized protein n=1 Tax=Phlebia brevispora TaxID=194682 RepID=A0ACC1T8N6_9APHY|nr:hypothetical protein NM688_g2544 [Phlebia brevispora]